MAFFGSAIKFVRGLFRAEGQVEKLKDTIERAEQEYKRPVLESFSGLQRFEAARLLLDSTLIRHLSADKGSTEKSIETYLAKTFGEYKMAREDLSKITATRAEVVALGVALKEISLTLDGEITSFQAQAKRLADEQRTSLQDTQRRAKETLSQLHHELKLLEDRLRERLEANLETSFKSLAGQVATRLSEAEAKQLQTISDLAANTRAEVFSKVQHTIEQHAAETRSILEKERLSQQEKIRAMESRLCEMERSQEIFRYDVHSILKVQKFWIFIACLMAVLATVLSLVI